MKRFLQLAALGLILVAAVMAASGSDAEEPAIAIVMKSRDNKYNEQVADGFRQVIEGAGYRCEELYPESHRARDQVALVSSLVHGGVRAVAVAASDEHALAPVLNEAREKGIVVVTLDSDTEPDCRDLFVSPADPDTVGADLVKAVGESCGYEGQWAILSSETRSANQGEWILAMQEELEKRVYKDMRLVNIVYGEDEYEGAVDKTKELLKSYPKLKVICSPTTIGIRAAADVIADYGLQARIKVVGLGLPSDMAEYIGGSSSDVCPVMYLWDPKDLGGLAASVSIGILEGGITLEEGAEYNTEDGRTYRIETGKNGGLKVTAGEPLKLDETNIDEWKDQM